MEKFIFIHGSASGQSTLPCNQASSRLCEEVSKWYFEGRDNRVTGTSVPRPMFVEFFKASDGKRYSLYSFVINECYGPEPGYRPGQYFAITIALQDYYCSQPSGIYTILAAAYDQLIRNKIIADKVVANGKEYDYVYKIRQFREKESELVSFQKQISDFFDKDCSQHCKHLPQSCNFPLAWNGETIHLTECDSDAYVKRLMNDGRVYISDKAPLLSDIVQDLRNEITKLNGQIAKLKSASNPKDKKEIDELKKKIDELSNQVVMLHQQNSQLALNNKQLQDENEKLKDLFKNFSNLIAQYNKENSIKIPEKNINGGADENIKRKFWESWWIKPVMIVIFILILISLFAFSRNASTSIKGLNSQIVELDRHFDTLTAKLENVCINVTSTDLIQTEDSVTTPEQPKDDKEELYFGLTNTDQNGTVLKSVYPGQIIFAKVTKPNDGFGFTCDGVDRTNPKDQNPISLKVQEGVTSITIGYGPGGKENRSNRQRQTLNVVTKK